MAAAYRRCRIKQRSLSGIAFCPIRRGTSGDVVVGTIPERRHGSREPDYSGCRLYTAGLNRQKIVHISAGDQGNCAKPGAR